MKKVRMFLLKLLGGVSRQEAEALNKRLQKMEAELSASTIRSYDLERRHRAAARAAALEVLPRGIRLGLGSRVVISLAADAAKATKDPLIREGLDEIERQERWSYQGHFLGH